MTGDAPLLKVPHGAHGTSGFAEALTRLRDRGETDFAKVEPAVREILAAVRSEGDTAVLRYVERFERRTPRQLYIRDVREADGKDALGRLGAAERHALELAAARITEFHARERDAMFPGLGSGEGTSGFCFEQEGRRLGLRVRPLARVGVYAPGGKARYPSSVLMSALPARVAGVESIVLATPLSGIDREDDGILAAAHLAGVSAILDAGGAQAIAALAFGTSSVPRVDKIVGPGNAYVACAKRLVFGSVAIDSIAGPSEILVVADETALAVHVAADLLSQAEHDEDAYPLLLTTDPALVDAVIVELERQLTDLPRAAIARESLRRHGHAFVVPDRPALVEVANAIAPEHLSLQVDAPEELLESITDFGAAFVGSSTPEAAGDYVAGPSHVLPTGGAVRFGSPLGVHDFVARSSVIRYTPQALEADEEAICAFARLEGLEAHARAVLRRTRTRT
jgi:histidinol dehydrogenase